jgi:hypothetical protein
MKQATTKKLEAAHHRWFRKILHFSWKDKVTNVNICKLTQQSQMEKIIRVETKLDGARAADRPGITYQRGGHVDTGKWKEETR